MPWHFSRAKTDQVRKLGRDLHWSSRRLVAAITADSLTFSASCMSLYPITPHRKALPAGVRAYCLLAYHDQPAFEHGGSWKPFPNTEN